MTEPEKPFADFLGTWILDPQTCEYEQGDPPTAGAYVIAIHETQTDRVSFEISWTDDSGESHQVEFSGPANGVPFEFSGGDLADQMVITAPSNRELNSSALYNGTERMTAQRQLDETRMAMRVTQVVRFPDGNRVANVGIYRRQVLN